MKNRVLHEPSGMGKIICNINGAVAAIALTMASLEGISFFLYPQSEQRPMSVLLKFLTCLIWMISAFSLRKSPTLKLWPWLGSLVVVAILTLQINDVLLKISSDIWRAQYGDRSVHIDPTTHGIPFIGTGILAVGTLCLLAALLSLPAWRKRIPTRTN